MSNPNLMAYYDGELGAEQSLEVQRHLQECAECRSQLEEWRSLDGLVRGEGPRLEVGRLRLPQPRPWRLALRAALLLLLVGLMWVLRKGPAPVSQPWAAQRYQVRHGKQTYRVETSGANLLMVDLEDEQGRAQALVGGES